MCYVVVVVVLAAVTLQFAAACSRGVPQQAGRQAYISHNEQFMQETDDFAAVNLLVRHGKLLLNAFRSFLHFRYPEPDLRCVILVLAWLSTLEWTHPVPFTEVSNFNKHN